MQLPIFGAEKGMTPHPICTNPTPLIIDRSLNTPHQRHYSSYLLIFAFWGVVVKDREAPFSPNYVNLKNFWSLMLLLVVFYLQDKVVEFNFSRNIMQTEYMAQLSRFVYMNAIAFKCIFSLYDQNSVSRLFTVIFTSLCSWKIVLGPDYLSRAGPVSRAGVSLPGFWHVC